MQKGKTEWGWEIPYSSVKYYKNFDTTIVLENESRNDFSLFVGLKFIYKLYSSFKIATQVGAQIGQLMFDLIQEGCCSNFSLC